MLILNILILIAATFVIGYYLGKGNIEIKRVMNKKDSEEALKASLEAIEAEKEAYDTWNSNAKQFFNE